MNARKRKLAKEKSTSTRIGFMRKTVTIPSELESFVAGQVARPQHAGNLSSYVRNLILTDREKEGVAV